MPIIFGCPLSWIIHPIIFVVINLGVVAMLCRQEFTSNALKVLTEIDDLYDKAKD